jgi:hypothetical protein
MIRDMTVRGFSPETHEAYIRQVVGLARHYRRPPYELSADEVQAYLAHLFQVRKLSWSTCAQAAHAFRFLCPSRRAPTTTTTGRRAGGAAA